MLKKRLVGVITVKDGWAVQSFGYCRYLPLGRPEILVENLDRWGVDEILVQCIDRSSRGLGPDLELLERIARLGLATPLTFSGGIRTLEQAVAVIQGGAERLCLDAVLHSDLPAVRAMSKVVGAQALVAGLPLSADGAALSWYDYVAGTSQTLARDTLPLFAEGVVSEALVIDWKNEGRPGGFDERLVRQFPFADVPLIAFGGLSEPAQLASLLIEPRVVAVAVGNFLSYSEHAVQTLKQHLTEMPLRVATYSDAT